MEEPVRKAEEKANEERGGEEPLNHTEQECLLRLKAAMEQVAFKVAVAGTKPGVGASTVASRLANALAGLVEAPRDTAEKAPRIGVLDLDISNGPSVAEHLGLEQREAEMNLDRLLPPQNSGGISVVTPHMLIGPDFDYEADREQIWSALREPLSRIDWGKLDALIIDLPADIDELSEPQSLLPRVEASIIVASPTANVREQVKRLWKFLDFIAIPPIVLVCTKGEKDSGLEAEELGRDFGIPICLDLPDNTGMKFENGETDTVFQELAEDLMEYLVWLHDEHDDEEVF